MMGDWFQHSAEVSLWSSAELYDLQSC